MEHSVINHIELIFYSLLSFLGGIVREISRKTNGKTFVTFLSEGFIGMFTGAVTYLLLVDYFNGAALGGICGLSGWMGSTMLDFLSKLVAGKIKLNFQK